MSQHWLSLLMLRDSLHQNSRLGKAAPKLNLTKHVFVGRNIAVTTSESRIFTTSTLSVF